METIEINGKSYLIDIEKATEQGVLKEKDNKPRSWKEYAAAMDKGRYGTGEVVMFDIVESEFHTKEEATAFAALCRLIHLRDAWLGEWRPSLVYSEDEYKIFMQGKIIVLSPTYNNHTLTFPNQKTADDFYETFKDLINAAKMFL